MKSRYLLFLALVPFAIISCQKEIDFLSETTSDTTGLGTNGALLIKTLAVDTNKDTAMLILEWDSSKHLIKYTSSGITAGIAMNFSYEIIRQQNGNISKIISHPIDLSGMVDSTIYIPSYLPGTGKLLHVVTTQYTVIFNLKDSAVYTFNSAGKISVKETWQEDFLTGSMSKLSRMSYAYDAKGNVMNIVTSQADAAGNYTVVMTNVYTYDNHKGPEHFAEESFIVIDPSNVSFNNPLTKTQAVNGQTITVTTTNIQYNSMDKLSKTTIGLLPSVAGYPLTVTYYYK